MMDRSRWILPLALCTASVWVGCSGSSGGPPIATHPVGTGATVTKSTGAAGGTITLDGTTLSIPPGALGGDQMISITSSMDPAPPGVDNLSPVYKFGPDGLV